jgi:hypothetical protein
MNAIPNKAVTKKVISPFPAIRIWLMFFTFEDIWRKGSSQNFVVALWIATKPFLRIKSGFRPQIPINNYKIII